MVFCYPDLHGGFIYMFLDLSSVSSFQSVLDKLVLSEIEVLEMTR